MDKTKIINSQVENGEPGQIFESLEKVTLKNTPCYAPVALHRTNKKGLMCYSSVSLLKRKFDSKSKNRHRVFSFWIRTNVRFLMRPVAWVSSALLMHVSPDGLKIRSQGTVIAQVNATRSKLLGSLS